jgi:hypothetical protein
MIERLKESHASVIGFRVVGQQDWSIRYLEVDTRNWWPGKKVLIAPDWIDSVSWADSQILVSVARETIQSAPEYVESRPITPDFEIQLHQYYGRLTNSTRNAKMQLRNIHENQLA